MIPSEPTEVPPISAPLTLTLFGPMQVWVRGQPLARLRSRKSLWALALLILRRGRPVEREWLAETLWPDADQDQAASRLRPILSELRKALGDEGRRLQSPGRYTLSFDTTDAAVDILRFDAAISTGTLIALEQATALYQRPLLEGCSEEWVLPEREAREQDCLRALETLVDAAMAGGRWSAAANYSRRAIALDPWRDGARRTLMDALARDGDINAALQVYREFAVLLRDDPKAAPDEQTTALYRRLRTEARRPAPAVPPAEEAAGKAPSQVRGYLPHPLTDLIGREDEREDAADLLRRSRLTTLVGPGGIGKTRLAIAVAGDVAHEHPDGVWLVALEALADGERIPAQIAEVLGLKEKEQSNQTPLEALAAQLRHKQLLIVLDNCEHLLEASVQVAGRLLRECAGVRILATSREALRITGEAVWAVPGLTTPAPARLTAQGTTLLRILAGYDSVRLFAERAPGPFKLTAENARTVAQICARLEGIPLALELAAARTRAMTAEQIAARLDNHLDLLTSGDRTAPSRQQTLRAALDWSYALLSIPEQLLLARMSVFAGGCTLEAAEAICSGDGVAPHRALDLLTSLVDKSLARFEEYSGEGGRYRLLEMVRQYAAKQLGLEETAMIRTRHRDWFLALAEEASLHFWHPRHVRDLERLWRDHDNLREALEWSRLDARGADCGLRLAGALGLFWSERGEYHEGRSFLRQALAREDAQESTATRGKALNGAAKLAEDQGDYAEARALYEESLAIYRRLGRRSETASALGDLTELTQRQGDMAACRAFYKEVRAIYDEDLANQLAAGDTQGAVLTLNWLGAMTYSQQDYAESRKFLEQNLELELERGDRPRIAHALHNLGVVAIDQGDDASGRAYFEQSLAILQEAGGKKDIAREMYNLGNVARKQGDLSLAQSMLTQSLEILREVDDKQDIIQTLNDLIPVLWEREDFDVARLLQAESIAISQKLGNQIGLAESLETMAALLQDSSFLQTAARLWSAAQSLREKSGSRLPLSDQEEQDRLIDHVRSTLAPEAFAKAWNEGRAFTFEQAAAYALAQTASDAS